MLLFFNHHLLSLPSRGVAKAHMARYAYAVHHILMPARLTITIPDEILPDVESQKPRSLALASFCVLLMERGLDKSPEIAKNQEQPAQRNDTTAAEPSSLTPPFVEGGSLRGDTPQTAFAKAELPAELETARDTFICFGKTKKGDRGQHGAKLAATGLKKIGEKYGWDVARDQLDLAINNRWNGISLTNYEKFLPKGATATQASEPNREHGTGRIFTAADFYGETNPDNPLNELF